MTYLGCESLLQVAANARHLTTQLRINLAIPPHLTLFHLLQSISEEAPELRGSQYWNLLSVEVLRDDGTSSKVTGAVFGNQPHIVQVRNVCVFILLFSLCLNALFFKCAILCSPMPTVSFDTHFSCSCANCFYLSPSLVGGRFQRSLCLQA